MAEISVIIPVYNVKKYLTECLNSLAVQSFQDCEFICIDDGSMDDSYKIIENYMGNDKRFKLIRQKNKGPAETRNVGIQNAHGKYIAFLDADDYFSGSNVLDKLYQIAEENNLDIVSFETELFYEGSLKEMDNKDFYYKKKNSYKGIRKGQSFFVEMMENQEYCDSACFLFVRREWMLGHGIMFYPGIFYEDALFCIQCFLHAGRMVHLSEKFYTYRVREKSIMTTEARWENVRSRVVLYREILYILFAIKNQDIQLQESLTDYLALIAFHAKYLDDFRVDGQSDEILEPLDTLLLKTMGLGNYRIEVNEKVILSGLEKLVTDSDGIILYGAGKVGRLFFSFLQDKGLDDKVMCYAVSKQPEEKTYMDGIPVFSIEKAVKKRGQVFLSVVEQQAQREMQKVLVQLGINQFEFFDQYIYRALRNYHQRLKTIGEIHK